MAFNVFCSTHTDRLIAHLAQSIRSAQNSANEIIPILLPSVPLREKLRVELARRLGVAMGFETLLPGAFFNRVSEALGIQALSKAWDPEGLFWRLLPPVRDLAAAPKSPLATLGKDEGAIVELTRQLADRFDQYQHYRPEMIRSWDGGKPWKALPKDAQEAERWQLGLWQKIKRAPDASKHLVDRFADLCDRLAAMNPTDWPFGGPLEVLSTGPFPKSTLEVLAALGRKGGVNLRVLLPSREHFRYLQSARAQRAQGLAVDKIVEGHPLLASLGAQARDSFAILEELLTEHENFEFLDEGPEEAPAEDLLRTIQQDIRNAAQPQPSNRRADLAADKSLRVHRCHGAQREIEVLRDELLDAFVSIQGLRAEDVLILSPKLDVHGPLVTSLFAAPGYRLPVALVEHNERLDDALLAAFCALLRFAAGRAPLTQGLGLIESTAARAVLGEEQAAGLSARLEAAGITFGLDSEHRGELGAGQEAVGTWRAGLDRLLEGVYFGLEEAPERPVDRAPSLPLADELSSGRGGALEALRWFEGLLQTAKAWQTKATPGEWVLRLGSAVDLLFAVDELDREALAGALAWLGQAAEAYGCDVHLSPLVLAAQLETMVASEQRRVRPVSGRIALGGLKPLRAMPCKVLALVGMDDPSFPRRSGAPAWDLMAFGDPLPGDRNPREEDRQLFLDALLAAKDRVIITAPVRHLVTNKDLPLSVCVDELLRTAAHPALLRSHPLQPSARENFSLHGSFDDVAAAIGQAAEGGGVPKPFADPGLALTPKPRAEALGLDELLRTLDNPARTWLRCLGVYQPDLRAGNSPDDDPMEMKGGLDRWDAFDREIRRTLKAGPRGEGASDRKRALATLKADRRLSYGELGNAQDRLVLAPARLLVAKLAAEGGICHKSVSVAALGLWGDLVLDAAQQNLVYVTASALDDPKRVLPAWARVCLAVVAGHPLPMRRFGMDKNGDPRSDTLAAPSLEEANRGLLEMLAFQQSAAIALHPFNLAWSFERAKAMGRAADGDKPLETLGSEQWKASYAKLSVWDPAFALAWRDQDPWKEGSEAWDKTAWKLCGPPLAWLAMNAEPAHV